MHVSSSWIVSLSTNLLAVELYRQQVILRQRAKERVGATIQRGLGAQGRTVIIHESERRWLVKCSAPKIIRAPCLAAEPHRVPRKGHQRIVGHLIDI